MSRRVLLSRRIILRGAGAGGVAHIAAPVLEAMLDDAGTAFAQGAPLPVFYGYVHWGNGVRPEAWVPGQAGVGEAWSLSPSLAPLAPVKDYLTVVSGTNIALSAFQHPQGSSNILTGTNYTPNQYPVSSPAGPSTDQIVASAVGGGHPFRSVEVGVYQSIEMGEGLSTRYISHAGVKSPNPPIFSPLALFERLFGKGPAAAPAMPQGTAPAPDPRPKYRASVLDVVLGDIKRLQARVGSADRRRLDHHFEGLRDLETRARMLAVADTRPAASPVPASSCRAPGAPSVSAGRPANHAEYEKVTKAMADLLAAALACNLTRVFTFQLTGSRDFTSYDVAGVGGNYHDITHAGRFPDITKVVTYLMKHNAVLLQTLRDMPYGAGNVLQQACILESSEVATGVDHRGINWPILVAGRAGGRIRANQHLDAKGKHTLAVHLACMKLAGAPISSFGQGGNLQVTEPIAGLAT